MTQTRERDVEVKAESSKSEGGGKVTRVSKNTEGKTSAARAVLNPEEEETRALETEIEIKETGFAADYAKEFLEGKPDVQANVKASEEYAEAGEAVMKENLGRAADRDLDEAESKRKSTVEAAQGS